MKLKYHVDCETCGAFFDASSVEFNGDLEMIGYDKPHCCIACGSEMINISTPEESRKKGGKK